MASNTDDALESQASANLETQVMFTESTDATIPGTQPENSSGGAPQVQAALKSLEAAGVVFQSTPLLSWIPQGKSASLRKSLSVTFSVDTIVSSNEIIIGFDSAGMDIDEIISIQRRTSNKTWVVTFSSTDVKEQALRIPFITIAGCKVFIGDAENKMVLVNIYEAQSEMPTPS